MEWKLNFRDDEILEIKSDGVFSNGDLLKMIEEIVSDPRWKPGMDVIADFREVVIKDITLNDIHKSKDIHVQFNDKIGEGKIALIFSTDLGFGLSRTYEAISGRYVKSRMMTFRNYKNGIEWIQGKESL